MSAAQTFESLLPEIQSRSKALLSALDPETRQDAQQELLVSCWLMHCSAVRRGRESLPTAYTLVMYSNRNYHSGRRIAGSSQTDALGEMTRRSGRSQALTFDLVVDGEQFTLADVLPDRRTWQNPYQAARAAHDWRLIADRCQPQERRVLGLLQEGRCTNEIAKLLKLSAGRVSQVKASLRDRVSEAGYQPYGCKRSNRGRPSKTSRHVEGGAYACPV